MLKESLANALHDASMDLALEQERVDGAAKIVDDRVAFDCGDAGIGIDLDLGDVAAVGEGLSWRHAVMCRIEPRLHACRQFRGIARRLRHRETREEEVGGGHPESPTEKTSVLRRYFQKGPSQLLAFVNKGAPPPVGGPPGAGRPPQTAAKP